MSLGEILGHGSTWEIRTYTHTHTHKYTHTHTHVISTHQIALAGTSSPTYTSLLPANQRPIVVFILTTTDNSAVSVPCLAFRIKCALPGRGG